MYCSSLTLNCFDKTKFLLFVLGTVLFPYIIYQKTSLANNWTRKRRKTLSQHYETLLSAFGSMSILWFLGNYEETFTPTTFLFVIVGILGFGYISEILVDTHHHTLATVHAWNGTMYNVVKLVALAIIILGIYHVQLASHEDDDFFNFYCVAGVIPVVMAYFAMKTVELQNENGRQNRVLFHLHHVHLFFALAFFTRFPTFVSRMAAGLCIGASMHGAAAFGFDSSFESV